MVPPLLLRRIVDFDLLFFLTRERLQQISIVNWLSKIIISIKSIWAVSLLSELYLNSCAIWGSNSASSYTKWKLCLMTLLSACWKWESSSLSEFDRSDLFSFRCSSWVLTDLKFFFMVLISFLSFLMLLLEDTLVLYLLLSSLVDFLLGQCEDGCHFF